jgi:hypothetical protein
MRGERQRLLDRVFARHGAALSWGLVPDVWAPPWRPRGRWWMRPHLPRGYRGQGFPGSRGWRHLTRPPRAS